MNKYQAFPRLTPRLFVICMYIHLHMHVYTPTQVLAVGSRLIVLGEVGEDPEGLAGDVVLRKAAPSSILDLKTTSISRPFVVSTKTEQGLLQVGPRWLALAFLPVTSAPLSLVVYPDFRVAWGGAFRVT